MSRYNNGSSIPIEDLSKENFENAVKEWAEGSIIMEKVLRECYNKKIETTGSHNGTNPYIGFHLEEENERFNRMVRTFQEIKGARLSIMSEGINPRSGRKWYQSDIGLGIETDNEQKATKDFEKIYEALISDTKKTKQKKNFFEESLDFYYFFAERLTDLKFYAIHNGEDKYEFNIITYKNNINMKYYNEIFSKAEFDRDKESENNLKNPFVKWSIKDEDPEKILKKLNKSKKIIFNNWSLDIPTKENEGMSLHIRAYLKMNEFGKTEEGNKKLVEWFNNELDKIFKKREEEKSYKEKIKISQDVIKDIENIQNNSHSSEKNNKKSCRGDEEK